MTYTSVVTLHSARFTTIRAFSHDSSDCDLFSEFRRSSTAARRLIRSRAIESHRSARASTLVLIPHLSDHNIGTHFFYYFIVF